MISEIRELLKDVKDPEIPALSIDDMGILRDVYYDNDVLNVVITPTYSGCPAMYHIQNEIENALKKTGVSSFQVITKLSPAWTTDWMTDDAKKRLKESGIAPPKGKLFQLETESLFNILKVPQDIECPFCDSSNTKLLNEFGSTACKSLYYCNNCYQAFDYFKCH